MIDTLITTPLREMLAQVAGFLPTVFISMGILLIGLFVSKLISKASLMLFRTIGVDKLTDKIGIATILKTGGIKHKTSDLLSTLIYWILMITVLTMTVKALGLVMVSSLFDQLLAYIPSIVSGVLVLIFGMLLAKVVSGLVYVTAVNTDVPYPDMISRLSRLAITIYVTVIFLKEIGFGVLFEGTHFTIVLGGVVLALSLAFGLGGKDIASRYLDIFKPSHK